jgi:hypothetical protein
MPRLSINYDNTHFYKLICKDVDVTEMYVGHTTNFSTRKKQHRICATNPQGKFLNLRVYNYINDNGGWDNFDMILIARLKCEDKLEALKIERSYIEELRATLNKVIPSRTQQEWTNDNIEKVRQYKEKYENKEQRSQRHEKEYSEHREEVIEKAKQYYKDNLGKCKAWKNGKTMCDCGKEYTNANKARHAISKFHVDHLAKLTIED